MVRLLKVSTLNAVILFLGFYSWVLTAQGLNVLNVSPSTIKFIEPLIGTKIEGIWLAYGLSLAVQTIITVFYLSLADIARRKLVLILFSTFAAGSIAFSAMLGMFSIVKNKQGEQMYQTLRAAIINQNEQVTAILTKAHDEYQSFHKSNERLISVERASGCRCLCKARENKHGIITQRYSGTLGNSNLTFSKDDVIKEKDLSKLYQLVETRIQRLELILPEYSSFKSSLKQSSFGVNHLGLNGRSLEQLAGYNTKTKFCPAFAETISVNFEPPNQKFIDKIKSQVYTADFYRVKNTITRIREANLVPIDGTAVTIDFLFEKIHGKWDSQFKWLLFYGLSPDIGALICSLIIMFCLNHKKLEIERLREYEKVTSEANEIKTRIAKMEFEYVNSHHVLIEALEATKSQLKGIAKTIFNSH